MKKIVMIVALGLALPMTLFAHKGHDHAPSFEPPHDGAFTEVAGHFLEVYVEGDLLYLCLLEADGKPAGKKHLPEDVELQVKARGDKKLTLKAEKADENACVSWKYSSEAKVIKLKVKMKVAGKTVKARLAYEMKKARPAPEKKSKKDKADKAEKNEKKEKDDSEEHPPGDGESEEHAHGGAGSEEHPHDDKKDDHKH